MPENDLFGSQPEAPAKAPSDRPTRELGRFIKFYKEKVRDCTSTECVGVIKNIQRMLDKGIGLDEIATALQNYADDEWRKSRDPRLSYPIRTFFSMAKIKEWLNPMPKPGKPGLPQINFTPLETPKPAALNTYAAPEEEAFEL
jgi:hypothetical protein